MDKVLEICVPVEKEIEAKALLIYTGNSIVSTEDNESGYTIVIKINAISNFNIKDYPNYFRNVTAEKEADELLNSNNLTWRTGYCDWEYKSITTIPVDLFKWDTANITSFTNAYSNITKFTL